MTPTEPFTTLGTFPLLTAAAWLLTFLVHSTVLLGGVWLAARFGLLRSHLWRETFWKAAPRLCSTPGGNEKSRTSPHSEQISASSRISPSIPGLYARCRMILWGSSECPIKFRGQRSVQREHCVQADLARNLIWLRSLFLP